MFTIGYNLLEGLILVLFGFSNESLTLFGFGVDSFIEVMSGVGILAMVFHPDVFCYNQQITKASRSVRSLYGMQSQR